jgi:hypothetical protein
MKAMEAVIYGRGVLCYVRPAPPLAQFGEVTVAMALGRMTRMAPIFSRLDLIVRSSLLLFMTLPPSLQKFLWPTFLSAQPP